MITYREFRKVVKFKGDELERITGYTRQGIDYGFKMLENGKKPSDKFLVCINQVIEKRKRIEIDQHQKEIKKLNELQNKLLLNEGLK